MFASIIVTSDKTLFLFWIVIIWIAFDIQKYVKNNTEVNIFANWQLKVVHMCIFCLVLLIAFDLICW